MRNLTLGVLFFALLTGCVRPPIEGRFDPYSPPQVAFASPGLANKTAVGFPIMRRDNGGILHVTVPIRSASDYDLRVDYRVTFLDDRGAPIYQGGWEAAPVLERNIPSEIQFKSPTANAADFRLDVRYSE